MLVRFIRSRVSARVVLATHRKCAFSSRRACEKALSKVGKWEEMVPPANVERGYCSRTWLTMPHHLLRAQSGMRQKVPVDRLDLKAQHRCDYAPGPARGSTPVRQPSALHDFATATRVSLRRASKRNEWARDHMRCAQSWHGQSR